MESRQVCLGKYNSSTPICVWVTSTSYICTNEYTVHVVVQLMSYSYPKILYNIYADRSLLHLENLYVIPTNSLDFVWDCAKLTRPKHDNARVCESVHNRSIVYLWYWDVCGRTSISWNKKEGLSLSDPLHEVQHHNTETLFQNVRRISLQCLRLNNSTTIT